MKRIFLLIFIINAVKLLNAQWTKQWAEERYFIENRGQFDVIYNLPVKDKIEYAYDGGEEDIFFTKNKVIYRFSAIKKKKYDDPNEEWRERLKYAKKGFTAEQWHELELNEMRGRVNYDFIWAEWVNVNTDVTIQPIQKN